MAQSRNSIRTYRVAQILDAEVTEQTFVHPKAFDLTEHWRKSTHAYETGTYSVRTDVSLSPRGLMQLDLLGPVAREEALRTASNPDGRGWVRCSLPIETGSHGLREIRRLGEDIEILGAATLRTEMMTTLAAIQRHYASRGLPPRRVAAK